VAVTTDVSTVLSESANQIVVTLQASSNMVLMTTCKLKIKKPDATDGAIATYSAVVRADSNGKNNGYLSGITGDGLTDAPHAMLLEGLRGLSVVTGRVTSASKYMFIIGGDRSTSKKPTNPTDQVEMASFNDFGVVLKFSYQRYSLPERLAFGAATVIGRFIYHSGGHNSTHARNKIYRAQILVPLETPAVTLDLDVELNDTKTWVEGGNMSFPEGLYYYRVSAKFPDNDANNPGGESLPGDPLSVVVPTIPDALVVLTLSWPAIPGADGYYLYRTPAASSSFETLSLLRYVNTTSFPDRGFDNIDTAKTPLPEGSLGQWRDMGVDLHTPRWGHGMAMAPNPADITQSFLYVGKGIAGKSYNQDSFNNPTNPTTTLPSLLSLPNPL
jgi:hypothetical protein